MWLKQDVVDDTLEQVELVMIDRTLAATWNEHRPRDEPVLFTGFYWINGTKQGGPFRSRSAAIRDAWYYCVGHRAPPAVGVQRKTRRKRA